MVSLRITYLQHGWVDASLSNGSTSAQITGSYISDAIGDLVRATLRLTQGEFQAECSWLSEPGEYRWLLRTAPAGVNLTILEFDEWHPRKPDAQGQLIFLFEGTLQRWVRQLLSEFQRLFDEFGDAGYSERWSESFTFPATELHELRLWLKTIPQDS
ncbi:hypothetical protein [Bryobacter aggregatus]|uniref:hypothetical protein n=1 Tax=Bryobacter aggregatus TaxID=360054 RepID=UPI0004E209D5|nr:hypothetical protein [Bryobacter aggregatus]